MGEIIPVVWIDKSVVFALHEEHLTEHGGGIGVRDPPFMDGNKRTAFTVTGLFRFYVK